MEADKLEHDRVQGVRWTPTHLVVFVSGYTCMLAYGGALQRHGWRTVVARASRV